MKSSASEEVFDDIFSYFSSKPYVVTPHLNPLIVMVQMRGHNIWLNAELTEIVPKLFPNTLSYLELCQWVQYWPAKQGVPI